MTHLMDVHNREEAAYEAWKVSHAEMLANLEYDSEVPSDREALRRSFYGAWLGSNESAREIRSAC